MKRLFSFIFFFSLGVSLFAQFTWQTNLAMAKKLSNSSGKFILIDFYADWCGPCKAMDRELWKHPEMGSLVGNFIPLRIDVDNDRATAMQYSADAIPKIVLAMSNGEMVWEMVGYSGTSQYLEILRSLPSNSSELFKNANALNSKDPLVFLKTGIELQKTGKDLASPDLKESFISLAQYYFRLSEKQTRDVKIKQLAGLYSVLNNVYKKNPKKAVKEIEKITYNKEDKDISELAHFILASCYKALKDDVNFLKEKEQITSETFLVQLDK